MLVVKLDYLIHFSTTPPKFVNVYRSMLPWEKWCDRVEPDYGFLCLVEPLSLGDGSAEKFSKKNILVVNNYTEAKKESLRMREYISVKG